MGEPMFTNTFPQRFRTPVSYTWKKWHHWDSSARPPEPVVSRCSVARCADDPTPGTRTCR